MTLSDNAALIGKSVAKLRRLYGITQIELAKQARIARSALSLFETGYAELGADEMKRLEKTLDAMVEKKQSKRDQLTSVPLSSLLQPPATPPAPKQEPVLKGFDDPQYASDAARDLFQQLKESQQKLKASTAVVRSQDALIQSQNDLITIERHLIDELLGRIAQLEVEDQVTKEQLKSLREWLNAEQIAALAHDDAEKKREQVHQMARNTMSEDQK